MAPAAVTAAPCGRAKAATVPNPSRVGALAFALPASVLTLPSGVTRRTRRLAPSATTTLPAASTATARGSAKATPAPRPSAHAAVPFPASVVTSPAGVIARITWLLRSLTYTVPLGATATHVG